MGDVATKKRGTEVLTDMLLSLGVVLVVVVPLWLIIPHHAKQTVTVVDYSSALSETRRVATGHVVAPVGLPATWRATSVSSSGGGGKPVVFHLGYLTPSNQYVDVEQSDGPSAAFLASLEGKSPQALPPVQVGATSWRQLKGADGRLALVNADDPMTVVVKGTAAPAELAAMAASLR
jgi:hypothetical protein